MYTVENPLAAPRVPLLRQRVLISGLAAKPEFNDCFGKCISYDESKGRYGVQLEGRSETLALKPSNLTQASAEDGRDKCNHCGMRDATLRCSRCFSVWYCHQECQRSGWAAHTPHCKAPPIAEKPGSRVTTHAQQETLGQHIEASIAAGRAGRGGAKDQEIRMLKQAAAADPSQPAPYFNLAQCYMEMGGKREAVEAMDKCAFYMLQGLEPGLLDLSDPAELEY